MGFNPWMASEDLLPGKEQKSTIAKAIENSTFFVVFLSNQSVMKRGSVQVELKEALKILQEKLPEDIYLLPVRLEPCDIPDSLGGLQHVDLFEEEGFDRLIQAINSGLRPLSKSPGNKSRIPNRDEGSMNKVFICHADKDMALAKELADFLKGDIKVFLEADNDEDLTTRNEKIDNALISSDYFLVVLSKSALGSESVAEQLDIARNLHKEGNIDILVFLKEKCNIPPFLKRFEIINYIGRPKEALKRLSRMVTQTGTDDQFEYNTSHTKPDPNDKKEDDRIPFSNQEKVIPKTLRPYGNPIRIVNGPPGSGKSYLLNQLSSFFSDPSSIPEVYKVNPMPHPARCILVESNGQSIRKLINKLFSEFGEEIPAGSKVASLGHQFGDMILEDHSRSQREFGYALLIDLNGIPNDRFLESLRQEFLPSLLESLWTDDFFACEGQYVGELMKFHIIIAGSSLSRFTMDTWVDETCNLHPFSIEHLQDTAQKYLRDGFRKESLDQLCNHIYHFSGGHTRCMAEILRLYKSVRVASPNRFIEEYGVKVETIVTHERYELKQSWPEYLVTLMEALCGYRYINEFLLGRLIEENNLSQHVNVARLIKRLKKLNYLIPHNRDARVLEVHHHRILGHLPNQDVTNSVNARNSCLAYLQVTDQNPQAIERWGIEYLFHSLNINTHDKSPGQVGIFRNNFFDSELPKILDVLTSINKEWLTLQEKLIEILKYDKDFQFSINYSLGSSTSKSTMFKTLIDKINIYFETKSNRGGDDAD